MSEDDYYWVMTTNDEGTPNVAVRADCLKGMRVASAWISEDGELYVVTERDDELPNG